MVWIAGFEKKNPVKNVSWNDCITLCKQTF